MINSQEHGRQANIWTRDFVCSLARELTQATRAHASMIFLQKQEKNQIGISNSL